MENKYLKVFVSVAVILVIVALSAATAVYWDRKSRPKPIEMNPVEPRNADEKKPDGIETNGNLKTFPAVSESEEEDILVSEKIEDKKEVLPLSKCGHDPKNDPILGDCAEDCNTDNWKVYKNKKYGYTFRYPASYALTNNCKNTECVSEEDGGDSVNLSGDLSEQSWPMVEIRHFETPSYNPPADTDQISWIKKNFSWTEKCFPDAVNIHFAGENGQTLDGFNIYFPKSPQAYSRREIFYNYKGKLFQIVMLDVDLPQARQFYDIWLEAFSVIGEK